MMACLSTSWPLAAWMASSTAFRPITGARGLAERSGCLRKPYNRSMTIEVDAVYENGILKPLQPLDLAENERVVVSITQKANGTGLGQLDVDFIQDLRRRLADAAPAPGLEEVRRRLSKIPGSMTADFIAEREDR
jgi:predicted DNA-binding antitoxin AbrB/MazE fold protein